MTADQFTKLMFYMNEQFAVLRSDIQGQFDVVQKQINSSINAIDGLYDRFDSLHLEYTATTSHQRRIQPQLNHYDTRITKLENA